MNRRSVYSAVAALVATLAIAITSLAASPTGAGAQTGEFRRGPDPTLSSISATTGPFATAQTSVPSSVAGFGGGTITYPTDTSQGTFGAFVFTPGFTATASSYTWVGPRVASQGFVVFVINTDSRFDNPSSRAAQAQNALDYLVNTSSVANRIDSTRLALSGHSMGGGGTLIATQNNTSLQAAVPLMPWNSSTTNFSGIRSPTMIIGAENDSVAPVDQHAIPFYNSIPASAEKAYLELAGQGHNVATQQNTTQARFLITWMKRYVDNDTRYEQFICPPPALSSLISDYRNTCPG
jgi:predicted dienelactone hydrolase